MASSSLPASSCNSIDTNGWTISEHKYPISNAAQLDELQASLGLPLPEMTFGNNKLVLKHHPSGWEYSFDTRSALESVKAGELGPGDGAVKVGYADAWLKSRCLAFYPLTIIPMFIYGA
jgi:type 2A phosphatase activator TIP41